MKNISILYTIKEILFSLKLLKTLLLLIFYYIKEKRGYDVMIK